MFNRLRKVMNVVKALAEIPERLAAIEERMKQLESYHTISIPSITYYPQYPQYPGTITSPNITWLGCVDGKGCEYPNPWFGINPASCKKCGIAPDSAYTITCCSENINCSN